MLKKGNAYSLSSLPPNFQKDGEIVYLRWVREELAPSVRLVRDLVSRVDELAVRKTWSRQFQARLVTVTYIVHDEHHSF